MLINLHRKVLLAYSFIQEIWWICSKTVLGVLRKSLLAESQNKNIHFHKGLERHFPI